MSAVIYQYQEIGESDWEVCDKGWYDHCQTSPEHNTRTICVLSLLKDFLRSVLSDDLEEFSNSHGLCRNWLIYARNKHASLTCPLQEWSIMGIRSYLTLFGVNWEKWHQFSGDHTYPIPSSDPIKYSPEEYYEDVMYKENGAMWKDDQLALRLDLCRWLLAELEKCTDKS